MSISDEGVIASNGHPGTWTFFEYDIIATLAPVAGQTQELSDVLSTLASQGSLFALSINGPGIVVVKGVINAPSIPDLTLNDGANLVLQGGTLNVGPPVGQDPLIINSGGKLSGYGNLTAVGGGATGEITNNGTITANGGALDINANVVGTGILTFGPDPSLILEGTVAATQSLVFNGPDATLLLGASANVAAMISGFAAGDTIGLEGQQVASAVYDTSTDVLALTGSSGTVFDLSLAGTYEQSDFTVSNGEVGSGTGTPTPTPTITAPMTATVGAGQASPIGGISVAETPTTTDETFTAVLTDTSGVLSATTAATAGGGTITPSNGGTTLTISGTLAQLNADLTTLTDTDASTAADTITVNAKDSNGGSATAGLGCGHGERVHR